LISELIGRKKGKKSILKGDSKESRIKSWYTLTLNDLLGKEPVMSDNDIPIL